MNVKIWKITTLLFVITFCFGRLSSQDQLSFISKQEDQSSLVEPMIIFQNELYFYANSAEYGKELWKTNGTTNGTKLLKDIAPGIFSSIGSSFNRNPVVMGDHLYFWANDGNSGDQVWRTDGTTENTIRVTDHPGQFKSDIVSSGNQLSISLLALKTLFLRTLLYNYGQVTVMFLMKKWLKMNFLQMVRIVLGLC